MLTNLEQFKPADFQHQVNTLKDMEQILHQYRDGLLTEAETLLAVQMTRAQVHAARVHRSLPKEDQHVSLAAWDPVLRAAARKAHYVERPKSLAGEREADIAERDADIDQFGKIDVPDFEKAVDEFADLLFGGREPS